MHLNLQFFTDFLSDYFFHVGLTIVHQVPVYSRRTNRVTPSVCTNTCQDPELELRPESRQAVDPAIHGQDGPDREDVHGRAPPQEAADAAVRRRRHSEGNYTTIRKTPYDCRFRLQFRRRTAVPFPVPVPQCKYYYWYYDRAKIFSRRSFSTLCIKISVIALVTEDESCSRISCISWPTVWKGKSYSKRASLLSL